jgi:Uncharacterized conserved protein, contains RING Zn-finger
MSKKFKSQASSSRAAASAFGSFGGFSGGLSSEGKEPSALTYIAAPPDLSRIAEQQLVIVFKNLLKKDDITRLKALEELRDHILTVEETKGTLDDGFLDAWVCIDRFYIKIPSNNIVFFPRSEFTLESRLIYLGEYVKLPI